MDDLFRLVVSNKPPNRGYFEDLRKFRHCYKVKLILCDVDQTQLFIHKTLKVQVFWHIIPCRLVNIYISM